MRKMLYLMNVEWNWIKQRPHFLAEELSGRFDVEIVYQHRYNRRGLQKRGYGDLKIKPLYLIPRIDRYNGLMKINVWLRKILIVRMIKKSRADMVYLTHPSQMEWIPQNFMGMVIYDCMDNYPEFDANKHFVKDIVDNERALCRRADAVLCTSVYLSEVLVGRYGEDLQNKIHIIRNGFNGKVLNIDRNNSVRKNPDEMTTLSYFGTISEWFDFDLILRSLEDFPNLRYVLMGPTEVEIPRHDRISYIGTVEHEKLYDACRDADCLIMPFKINELIKAVDPVKLYEYINFDKPIITVGYPEIERFSQYAYLYNGYDEYKKTIAQIVNGQAIKYSREERTTFLNENAWENRADAIKRIINEKAR